MIDSLKTWWNDPRNKYIRWVRVGFIGIALILTILALWIG